MNSPIKKIVLHISIVALVAVLLVSAFFLPEIWARFRTEDKISDGAQVAGFVLESDLQTQSTNFFVPEDLLPGSAPQSFTFFVTNQKSSGAVSEVDLTYTVVVSSTANLPLVFTLERIDEAEPDVSKGGVELSGEMSATDAQTHQYRLTVEWGSGEADKAAQYADKVDLITITVNCEQVD